MEEEVAEFLLKAEPGSGRRSVYMDVSFESSQTGRRLHFNTCTVLKDEKTPVRRERSAACMAVLNAAPGDIIVLQTYVPGRENMQKHFEKDITELLHELDTPPPAIDPRTHTDPDKLYYIWVAPDT
jgi:hypothetical protein